MSDRLQIQIEYPINNPDEFKIKSNVKEEKWTEVLNEYVRTQVGLGEDRKTPSEKEIYTIQIELDLSNDAFYSKSDTGNKGLTTGIVMDVIGRLGRKQA